MNITLLPTTPTFAPNMFAKLTVVVLTYQTTKYFKTFYRI